MHKMSKKRWFYVRKYEKLNKMSKKIGKNLKNLLQKRNKDSIMRMKERFSFKT